MIGLFAARAEKDPDPLVQPPPPGPGKANDQTVAQQPPGRLEVDEIRTANHAAFEARRRYPGPVGVILARAVEDYAMFGYRTDHASPVPMLIQELAP